MAALVVGLPMLIGIVLLLLLLTLLHQTRKVVGSGIAARTGVGYLLK